MINSILPCVSKFSGNHESNGKTLCIVSEGFEQRSLAFIQESNSVHIDKIIVCKYSPARKESKYDLLIDTINKLHSGIAGQEIILEYNRFSPYEFEEKLLQIFSDINTYQMVIIDISVMSKYMIMQLLCTLGNYNGCLKVIYTEPKNYAPTEEEFASHIQKQVNFALMPSDGVHDIIRTPLLTSTIMQKSPALFIVFLSFNERLISAVLLNCEPSRLFLVGSVPAIEHSWREKAIVDIHKKIINEHKDDNQIDDSGLIERRVGTLDYRATINLLAQIYLENCIDYRIVLAPTGSKMQALGCSIIKLCCPDIHIEYPTPESYYIDGYSSSEIKEIHEVVFENMPDILKNVTKYYNLDQNC